MNIERGLNLFNLFNFTVLFGLYIKLYHVDGMNKYEIVQTIKDICEEIIGKDFNDKYGIYFITLYHYPAIITTILALILVTDIKYFIVNYMFIAFIGYTNIIFKGCLVRKYERLLLNGYDSYVTRIMNRLFDVYFTIFNIDHTLNNKIVSMFYVFFIAYIALSVKLLNILSC